MGGDGAPVLGVDGTGLTVDILATQWHSRIMDALVAGAIERCDEVGASYRVTRVPGSFELTVAAEQVATRGSDAIIALGLVIRGETPHFDYVCASVTQGLTDVSRVHRIPVGFGVLTTDDEAQALARSGIAGSKESKGREAAEAAIAMVATLRELGK